MQLKPEITHFISLLLMFILELQLIVFVNMALETSGWK